MKKTIVINEICAALILLLYVYTALSKVLDMNRFLVTMTVSPFPYMKILAPILVWAIPLIEFAIGASMLINKFQKFGFIASAVLLGLFEIYIGSLLLSGLHLPCSCGGVISKLSWEKHLFFNLAFIVISLIPLYLKTHKKYKEEKALTF